MRNVDRFYKNISNFIFVSDPLRPADVIFIPGNTYPDMAEYAAKLWTEGYGKWILPSGKYSIALKKFPGPCKKKEWYGDTYETEWEFLKAVLMKNGVPGEIILKEDQAAFTYDNAVQSRKVLKEKGIEPKTGIICCNSVHARRCKMYYELVFPECEFMMAPVSASGITAEDWYQSEIGIESVLSEMDRCGRQFQQILEELQR